MPSILKHAGRLAAFLVAGVLALTVLSTAPGSAAPAKSAGTLAATTSAKAAVSARTLARRAPVCWRHGHKCFGSIAVNPATSHAYFANDASHKPKAKQKALAKCRRHAKASSCRSAGWVRNGCLGVAARVPAGSTSISQWAAAIAARYPKALKMARAKLDGANSTHHNWAWLCTTRRG